MSVTDDQAMPYSLWGKIKKTVGGVGLSARMDTKSSNMNSFDLDLQAVKGPTGIQLKGKADTEDNSVAINNLKLSQKIAAPGGSLTLVPKYNIPKQKADITLSYGTDMGTITIDANKDKQKVTISKDFGDEIGAVKPSITTDGDVELQYSRSLGSGSVAASYKPNEYAEVTYTDGPWEATVTAPMDNFENYANRIKFNLKRSVDVTGM